MTRLTTTLALLILGLALLPSIASASQAAIAPLIFLLVLITLAQFAMPPRRRR